MRQPYGFDPTTNCHERRSLNEIWLPYLNLEDKEVRDAIWGRTPEEYERIIEYEQELECHAKDVNLAHASIDVITRKRFNEAYNAVCFANFIGHTLNVDLTINWEGLGYQNNSVDSAYKTFMDRHGDWTLQRKIQPFFYTVFENGIKKGLHSHTGLHVPREFQHDFKHWLGLTLGFSGGGTAPREVFDVRPNKPFQFLSQWKWFWYIMKGVDPALTISEKRKYGDTSFHAAAGLRPAPYAAGRVDFKRVRVSRYLGPQARRAHGYGSDLNVLKLEEGSRYGDAHYRRGIAHQTTLALSKLTVPTP